MYRWLGKRREMGLGSVNAVSLSRAREKAAEARGQIADGINPLEAKRRDASVPTFGSYALEVIQSLSSQWRNAKHRDQWQRSLETYAAPLWNMPVNRIETADVLRALKPIWTDKAETASRVRGRIEKILDAAAARGYRTGENPARWRGHLENLLAKRQKLQRGHHPAMPYSQVPTFMGELAERGGVAARALEFVILTGVRSGEARNAVWSEIDFEALVWTIPAARMKAAKEHRVPLTAAAVAVLEAVQPLTGGAPNALVFPGTKGGPLSDMSLAAVLRRMGYPREAVSVHGFRSTFRDWVAETTEFPSELAEAALAHIVGDAVERAYRRGDALERRRHLMEAWCAYMR
jgi:integrase